MPTVFYWGPVDGGSGKTLYIMITYYLIGQYISKYSLKVNHKVLLLTIDILVVILGNFGLTLIMGGDYPMVYLVLLQEKTH